MDEDRLHKPARRPAPQVRAVLAIVAAVLASTPALAGPSTRLIYTRAGEAERCPDEEAVRAAVAARLGYDPFFPWATTTVVVDLKRTDGRFRADVRLIDETGLVRGARHLEAPGDDCADLMAAMALTISLVVDPFSLTPPTPAPAPDASTQGPVAESAHVEPPAPVAAPISSPPQPRASQAQPIHVYGGAGVLGSLGTGPGPSFGGDVLLGARRGVWSVELDARGELPASTALRAGTAQTERLMGSLVPCLHLGLSLLCPVGSIAWIHASGSGLSSDRSGSAVAGALGARAGAELKLGPIVRLRGYVDVLGELLAPQLEIGGKSVLGFSPVSGDIGFAALVELF